MPLVPIPAIDLIDGECVRLSKGDYNTKIVYSKDPLDMALRFEDAGLKRLHLVDLDGAKAGKVMNWRTLERISSKTSLQVDFGGGVKSDADVAAVLNSGGKFVTVGSLAVKNAELMEQLIESYGPDIWIIGADVRNEKIAVSGWLETSQLTWMEFITTYKKLGINYFLCTDIDKDGMLSGTSTPLYKKILDALPGLRLIASGGVSCLDDLDELNKANVPEVVIGKAIYESKITLSELANYNALH